MLSECSSETLSAHCVAPPGERSVVKEEHPSNMLAVVESLNASNVLISRLAMLVHPANMFCIDVV